MGESGGRSIRTWVNGPSETHRGVLRCQWGPVFNGAGSVQKIKKKGDTVKRVQRLISNFVPTNAFQRRLEGDDVMLPYLGQVTLRGQGEDEVLALNSEDFTSWFNLYRLPQCWRRYMAFNKLAHARAFGGPPDKMCTPACAYSQWDGFPPWLLSNEW